MTYRIGGTFVKNAAAQYNKLLRDCIYTVYPLFHGKSS